MVLPFIGTIFLRAKRSFKASGRGASLMVRGAFSESRKTMFAITSCNQDFAKYARTFEDSFLPFVNENHRDCVDM